MEGVLEWDTQRPIYGFFIDHTLDAVTTCMIFLGAGLSPLFRMDVSLFILAGYLCLSIYTYIRVHGTYGVPAAPYLDKHLVYLYALHEATL